LEGLCAEGGDGAVFDSVWDVLVAVVGIAGGDEEVAGLRVARINRNSGNFEIGDGCEGWVAGEEGGEGFGGGMHF
jgi:hypothetical protein